MTGPVSWSLLVHSSAEYFIVNPITTKCGGGLTQGVKNDFMDYALKVITKNAHIPMKILLSVLVYIARVKPEPAAKNKGKDLIYTVFDGALMCAGTVC